MINGHNHCGMSLFRGMADDLPLEAWLFDNIFPAENNYISKDTVYWCTKLAAAEMILSGTTSVADCYLFSEQAASGLHDAGMRGIAAHGVIDFPTVSVPEPKKNIEAAERYVRAALKKPSLIAPAVFAHAPYTCSPRTLKRAKQLADRYNLRFFIHCAETSNEHTRISDARGATTVEHLFNLELLDENTTCVHSIWVDDHDLELLAGSGATVVTCPASNAKLGAGIAPVHAMLEKRITVGLGTDSCASNNSLDMFREMDILTRVQNRAANANRELTAEDAFACATAFGGPAIGISRIGRISPGFHADLVVLNSDLLYHNLCFKQDLSLFAGSGHRVETVIIDGKLVLHEDRLLTIDLEEVYEQIQKSELVR